MDLPTRLDYFALGRDKVVQTAKKLDPAQVDVDGSDATLQVTNPLTTAGGEDVEDDDTFRARIRDFWRTARRGILAAIEFGAKTVPGVVSAQAVEALSVGAAPARVVNLYIADSSGVSSEALA